ncbi:MAG TPA: FtsX-like permease family protein [Candidatus Binatia bacterium]|nr:FtsX-like permease family protein [Candidatus Binatia bacterium]
MSAFSRGVRNAFRNKVRTFSVVLILGLSIGLALAMLLAHQAVTQKIDTVKSSVGNTITVSPAGFRGFSGGGNPLTQSDIDKIENTPHVVAISETLTDRLTSDQTNLQSSITAGSLGQRFSVSGGGGSASFGGEAPTDFTPPVMVIGTNDPTNLSSAGGGTFKLTNGQVFSPTSKDNVAIIGSALASKNNLSVGSTFTAYNTTIKVVGIFDGGNTFADAQLIMPLATVQTLSGQAGDITSAVVTVDSVDNLDSTTTAIKNTLGTAADVTNDQTRTQDTIDSLQNIQSISLYSLIGAVIAGSVIIFLTMLMIVRERRTEIGVTKAIGASNFKVMWQFMVEAMTLTLLAAVAGIIIGVVAADPITKTLVNNASTTSSTVSTGGGMFTQRFSGGGIAVGGGPSTSGAGPTFVARGRGFGAVRSNITNIHAAVGWSILVYGLAAALLIALIGSAIASWSIAKVRPAEVMRAS